MNVNASIKSPALGIQRANASATIFLSSGASLAIRAGTLINGDAGAFTFPGDTEIAVPDLIPGEDYGVRLDEGRPFASLLGPENPIDAGCIGGFHFAPGGNASARSGGDATPAINPCSLWDIGFRPACPDPRGMKLVQVGGAHLFWDDIYWLGTEHERYGTSRCGATIATGETLDRLNYHDAVEILAKYGKRLSTYDEARASAYGVTERSSADGHPKMTGLDAARTSATGSMQATGNVWGWITDGDPDDPRPSIFGGSWLFGSLAGSRCADLDVWPDVSGGGLGVRAACDHLAT
ncbi:hypothetical protein [Shinella zoogloeoides]|uniref:hypothetical protein n=1 Tax=Shinella zoogloeoides TaxID=352475 RepID=UPI001F589D9B|nr:hypothetical protein [Shinella zoogloeoides]